MPKLINNIAYLSFPEIESLGIHTAAYIKKNISTGHPNFLSIKDPSDKRKVLIKYEALSEKYKVKIQNTIGDPTSICQLKKAEHEKEISKTNQVDIKHHWEIDPTEFASISNLESWDKTDPSTPLQIMNIARACAICRWYNSLKPSLASNYGFNSKPEILEAIHNHEEVQLLKGFWTANLRHFQRKFTDYKRGDFKSLLSKKLGNTNNIKLKTEAQKETLRRLYNGHSNRDYVWISDEYNRVARLYDWPSISESTVREFLADEENQIQGVLFRNGTKDFKSKVTPVKHRDRPSKPGYLWEGDGTPWELYYKAEKKINGKDKVTYWNRKYVYMVTDAYNDLPVGWAIGETENIELITAAWKNAILNTGMMPWQIRVDNFARKTMGKLYDQVSEYFIPTGVGNARTKLIEHVFGQFSATRILKKYPNWSGCNITNRTESNQPNREFLDKEKKEFPTENEVIEQIQESINEYRNSLIKKKGLIRFEDWLNKIKETEKIRVATHEDLIEVFGVYRQRTYTFDNDGLTMIINGEERHWMDWEEENTWKYKELWGAENLRVKYLPEDLNMIRVDHPIRKKVYYLPIDVPTPGCVMDMKDNPNTSELLYKKLRFEKALIGEVISAQKKTQQVTNEVLANLSVDAQGIVKSMFTVDGENKQYMNQAQNYLKALDKTIVDRKATDQDMYDEEIDERESVAAEFKNDDLYD